MSVLEWVGDHQAYTFIAIVVLIWTAIIAHVLQRNESSDEHP